MSTPGPSQVPIALTGNFKGHSHDELVKLIKDNLKAIAYGPQHAEEKEDWQVLVAGGRPKNALIQKAIAKNIPIVLESWIHKALADKKLVSFEDHLHSSSKPTSTSSRSARGGRAPEIEDVNDEESGRPRSKSKDARGQRRDEPNERDEGNGQGKNNSGGRGNKNADKGKGVDRSITQQPTPGSSRSKTPGWGEYIGGLMGRGGTVEPNDPLQSVEREDNDDPLLTNENEENKENEEKDGDDDERRRYRDFINGKTISNTQVICCINEEYPEIYQQWMSNVADEALILRLPVHPGDVDKPEREKRKDYPMVVDFMIRHFFVVHDPLRAQKHEFKDQYLIPAKIDPEFKAKYAECGGNWRSATGNIGKLKGKSPEDVTWWGFAYDGRTCYATGVLEGEAQPSVWTRSELKSIWKKIDTMIDKGRAEFGHSTLKESKITKASCADIEIVKKGDTRVMSMEEFQRMESARRRLSG